MFQIDEVLLNDFQVRARELYSKRKIDELKEEVPFVCELIKEEQLSEFMQMALAKADRLGLSTEREHNGIIYLMAYLGCEFDTDPQYPWAKLIDEHNNMPTLKKLENVYSSMQIFYDNYVGPEHSYLNDAMKRITDIDFYWISNLKTDAAKTDALRNIYPEKFDLITYDLLSNDILKIAKNRSIFYGINSNASIFTFYITQFIYGYAADTDPLHANIFKGLDAGYEVPIIESIWGALKAEASLIIEHIKS